MEDDINNQVITLRSNEHKTQQSCSVNRLFHYIRDLISV